MKNSSTGSVNRSRASKNGSYSTKDDIISLGKIMKKLFLFEKCRYYLLYQVNSKYYLIKNLSG
jgi:hypothetical protein